VFFSLDKVEYIMLIIDKFVEADSGESILAASVYFIDIELFSTKAFVLYKVVVLFSIKQLRVSFKLGGTCFYSLRRRRDYIIDNWWNINNFPCFLPYPVHFN
jgi:hypothetical protein